MDWKEAAGVIIGGITLLLPAVKWLISDWAKKAEMLEVFRAKNAELAIEKFDAEVKSFRLTVETHNRKIEGLEKLLTQNNKELQEVRAKLEESKRVIEGHTKNLEGNVRQLIRTELVNISKDATLIRDKKPHGKT